MSEILALFVNLVASFILSLGGQPFNVTFTISAEGQPTIIVEDDTNDDSAPIEGEDDPCAAIYVNDDPTPDTSEDPAIITEDESGVDDDPAPIEGEDDPCNPDNGTEDDDVLVVEDDSTETPDDDVVTEVEADTELGDDDGATEVEADTELGDDDGATEVETDTESGDNDNN